MRQGTSLPRNNPCQTLENYKTKLVLSNTNTKDKYTSSIKICMIVMQ